MNCVVKIENPTTEIRAKNVRMITGRYLFRLSCNDQERAYYFADQAPHEREVKLCVQPHVKKPAGRTRKAGQMPCKNHKKVGD